jgi:hypothetical protein
MKIIPVLLLIAAGAVHSAAARPQPFSITIRPEPAKAKAGSQIVVEIEMKNLSDHNVDCSKSFVNAVDIAFRYDIRNARGKPLPKRTRKHPELGEVGSGYPPCTLKPGETTTSSAVISMLYDLTKPGRYTIQVSRPLTDEHTEPGRVYSNKITVTVTP